jgi:hypothetical protein
MRFSRTTTFHSLPSFYFSSHVIAFDHPLTLEVFDGRGNLLDSLDQSAYGIATFYDAMWPESTVHHPIRFEAGETYFFRLIRDEEGTTQFESSLAPSDMSFPTFEGITAKLAVPGALFGGARLIWKIAESPPINVPRFDGGPGFRTIGYASVLVLGNVTYDGDATVDVSLPAGLDASAKALGFATFDPFKWTRGWTTSRNWQTTVRAYADTVKLTIPIDSLRLLHRRYIFALYGTSSASMPNVSTVTLGSESRPIGVALGSSDSLLTVMSTSAIGCAVDFAALPSCQLDLDPALAYPGLVGEMAGIRMLNFSSPGAQTTVDYTVGDSVLTLEVPLIPPESSFVLFGGGVSDIANYSAGDLTQRLNTIDAAIRKRVPRAHIIYVGMRYFNDTLGDAMRKPLIDAWDDRERQLATSHGDRFVDTRVIVAPGRSVDSPDGAHYSLAANRRIAAAIVRSIESLEPH